MDRTGRTGRTGRARASRAVAVGVAARILFGLVLLAPGSALADPCEANLPSPSTHFSGPVRYVGDGDSLCVGPTSDPATWIEVRLADFYAPELHEAGGQAAKAALTAAVRGVRLDCVAGRRSYDRVVAKCAVRGRPLGDVLRSRGGAEGGRGLRGRPGVSPLRPPATVAP